MLFVSHTTLNKYNLISFDSSPGGSQHGAEGWQDLAGCSHLCSGFPGKLIPDSFASAVNYHIDEHLSFRFVIDFNIRVGEMPKRDRKTKLERVLSSIEKAAYLYRKKTGKPVVIVNGNVNWITEFMPGVLERIQEKAKLWADKNIAKVVLVSNDEKTEETLQSNHSAWARGALPVIIGDLSPQEAREFLLLPDPIIARAHSPRSNETMSNELIDSIIKLLGGRLQHLFICKLEWAEGRDFHTHTSLHLRLKERIKFYKQHKSRHNGGLLRLCGSPQIAWWAWEDSQRNMMWRGWLGKMWLSWSWMKRKFSW